MINDLASLQDAIADWLKRADLAPSIPTFIALAEARLNRDLFVWQRQAQATGTTDDGVIPIPDDLDRLQSLQVPRGGRWVPIDPVPPNVARGWNGAGVVYTAVNGEYRVSGTQDTQYALDYWARIPRLTDAEPQNWLIEREPGLYLYGALVEATPYIQDDSRITTWAGLYQSTLDGCNASDGYARYGNAPAMTVGGHATP